MFSKCLYFSMCHACRNKSCVRSRLGHELMVVHLLLSLYKQEAEKAYNTEY